MKSSERRKRREASFIPSPLLALAVIRVIRMIGGRAGSTPALSPFASVVLALAAFGVMVVGCAPPMIGSVGAMLGKDVHNGRLFVREVPPEMAAAQAGVRDGDEVIAVDGVPVAEMSPTEVHHRLEGVVGSKVVLLIVRDGETRKIEVVRGPLKKE